MLGVGEADLERALIIVVVLLIFAIMVWSMAQGRVPVPQVPPTVAPLLHPRDEDVRELKHFRANVEQKLPSIEERVIRQDQRLTAIKRGIDEIKQETANTGRLMQI